MNDIVKRLREPPFGTETSERNLMNAAADEITTLIIDLQHAYGEVAFQTDKVTIHGEAVTRLTAENERLRAALDILQAAMTAKKPIPLAFKKAIIEARAASTQENANAEG